MAEWARKTLGHRFANEELLTRALTHASDASVTRRSYERLEFLGDRVLGCVIAEWLFRELKETEGDMARRFAGLVDKATCAEVARSIRAYEQLTIAPSARAGDVHLSDNTMGDVCEALIGALYIDGGMPAAKRFIRSAWAGRIDAAAKPPHDPKSALQEWAQGNGLPLPAYRLVRREGPDHAPRFRVAVSVPGIKPAEAEGTSKQEAEKIAASALLQRETGA